MAGMTKILHLLKKLFTLEYGRMRDIKEILHEELRQEVADHQYDYDSNAVQIARLTLQIRYMQMWLASYAKQGWRVGRGMYKLRRLVDRRRCQLGIFFNHYLNAFCKKYDAFTK